MYNVVLLTFLVVVTSSTRTNNQYDQLWKQYKIVHNKHYDSIEESFRRLIFEDSAEKINQHNLETDLGLHSYRLGLNKFADRTSVEFVRSGFIHRTNQTTRNEKFLDIPDEVDWRRSGLVPPVRDQGMCGLQWPFLATEAVASQITKLHKKHVFLSVQNLIDCSKSVSVTDAFEYMKKFGVDTEDCYPFSGCQVQSCHFDARCIGATIKGYKVVPSGNENSLQSSVANVGPLPVAVDASHFSFQLYSGGIYYEPQCSSSILDHAMMVVGYGTDDRNGFWIVKNSWGESWGEDGYIRMARNKDNNCGIATFASYPVVA